MARPILIDTDPGTDDAVAILLALGAPELDLGALVAIAGNAPLTIRAVKAVVSEMMKDESKRDLKRAQDAVDACFKSRDYEEGRKAFMEKRKPVFTGS